MTREGEGAILEVKVSEMEKEPFGPEKGDRRRGKAAHPLHGSSPESGGVQGPRRPPFLSSVWLLASFSSHLCA